MGHQYFTLFSKTMKIGGGEQSPPTLDSLNKQFCMFNPDSVSGYSIIQQREDSVRLIWEFCRELIICNHQKLMEFMLNEEKDHYGIMATRGMGQQYTTVSRLFQEYKSLKPIEDLIFDTLGLRVYLRGGTLNDAELIGHNLPVKIEIMDGEKALIIPDDGYVTAYTTNWENTYKSKFPVAWSAVLALLREPVLMEAILKRTVRTPSQLIDAVIKLAYKRKKRTDSSYLIFSELSHKPFHQLSYLKEQMLDYLCIEKNSDGSDWQSMTFLAEFLYVYKSLPEDDDLYNGPVSTAIMQGHEKLAEFRDTLSSKMHARYIWGVSPELTLDSYNIDAIEDEDSEEDYDDFSDDDDEW